MPRWGSRVRTPLSAPLKSKGRVFPALVFSQNRYNIYSVLIHINVQSVLFPYLNYLIDRSVRRNRFQKGATIKGKELEMKLNKYICDICGWIYDPEIGDPDSGIDPGTPFEEIPDDWVCPVCGVDKSNFSLYEE